MDNETRISLSFKNNVTGDKKLKEYEERLKNIYSMMGAFNTGQAKDLSLAEKGTKSLGNTTEKTVKSNEKMAKQFNSMFNMGGLFLYTRQLTKLVKTMAGATQLSVDYIENTNLLEVAYSRTASNAEDYNQSVEESSKAVKGLIEQMSKVYGFDENRLTRSFGIFKQMANAMKLPSETAENLSEHLVKMSNDIASLYNLDLKRAENALQSALAGQVRPIRTATGADITEKTLQQTVDNIGLDKSISQLSYVEKRLIMVISLTEQLKKSQGDYGRTIESASNQIRVMKEQWARLSRAVGNVFLPILQAVLPYINAVLMILTKVFNLLASLLGFKMPKFDYSGLAKVDDAVGDVVDGMNDVSDSAGNAGKAVDKLKDKMSGLRTFDKLNVINSKDDKGSSGTGAGGVGGGAGGGIDPAILDAFNDIFGKYDDMLDGIKMKATKIAEAFEAWATYLKPLEKPLKELAGLTYSGLIYVWNNVLKPLAKWTAYKLIPQLAKTTASALEVLVAVGKVLFKIYKMIYEVIVLPFARSIGNAIINSLKVTSNILDAIAKNKVATTLLALVVAFTRLKTVANLFIKTKIGGYLSTFGSLLLEPIKGTRNLTTVWKNFISLVTPLKLKSITGELTTMQKATTILGNTMKALGTIVTGVLISFAGFQILKGSLEDISVNGAKVGNVLSAVAGSVMVAVGAVTALNAITAIFGVTLTALPIIGIVAGLTALGVAIVGIGNAQNEFTSGAGYTKKTINEIDEAYKDLDKTLGDLSKSHKEAMDNFTKSYEAKLMEIDGSKAYIDALDDVVDGNYRVKEGYESVAETILGKLNDAYGTQLKIEGGVIKNGEQIVNGKKTLINITNEYIEAIKKQTLFEGYQTMYKKAVDEQIEAKIQYKNTTDQINKSLEETAKKLKNGEITADQAGKVAKSAHEKQEKAVKKYKKVLGETDGVIKSLDEVTKVYAKGSSKELEETIVKVASSSKKSNEETDKSFDYSYKKLQKTIDKVKKAHDEKLKQMRNNSKLTVEMRLDDSKARKAYNKFASDINQSSGGGSPMLKYVPTAKFATGGLPKVGQLFVANEQGPELVGNIGGQSFVANQNQMMDLLDRKIGNAQSKPMNATFVIQVGSKEVAREVITDLQGMAKTNGKPIIISG